MALHWIAELQIDGRWWRWGHQRHEIVDADGNTLTVRPGLLSDIQIAQGDEVSIEVADDAVDWPTVALALERTEARLLLWESGTTYEAATVYSRGLSTGVTYGQRRASWDITEDQLRQGLVLPDPLAMATEETWPVLANPPYSLPESSEGQFYPVVFGMPGYVAGRSAPYPVVPCPLVQYRDTSASPSTNYVAISDRALPSTTTQVYAQEVEGGVAGWQPVTSTDDALGRTIGVHTFATTTTMWPATSQDRMAFYAGFHETTGGGGARYRGAHEVIMWLLRTWAADTGVDWARMQELEWLDAYKVDTWINAPTRAWDWLEATLLKQLPVSVRHSTTGRYLERDRYNATALDALGTLDSGRGDWEPRTDVSWAAADIANEFIADFRRQRTGVYVARRTITAESTQVSRTFGTVDDRVLAHPRCRASKARFGLRPADPIQILWTWDEATVFRVLEDEADRRALPYRELRGWVRDGTDLRTGDVYLLTDERLGLSSTVAIVAEPPLRVRSGAVVLWRLPWTTT